MHVVFFTDVLDCMWRQNFGTDAYAHALQDFLVALEPAIKGLTTYA